MTSDPRAPQPRTDPTPNLDAAPGDDMAVPSDNTSLLEVLRAYEEAGYPGQFSVVDDALVLCHTCRSRSEPDTLAVTSMRRLEGASDPADMMVLAVITCPICATGGVLTMNYGPEATAEQAEVQAALNDRRGSGSLPANRPPDTDQS